PLSAPGGGVAVRDDVRPAARRRRTATRGGPGGRRRVRGRSTMVRMTWTGFGIVTPLLLVLTGYLAVLGALSVGEGVGARLTFAGVFLAGAPWSTGRSPGRSTAGRRRRAGCGPTATPTGACPSRSSRLSGCWSG